MDEGLSKALGKIRPLGKREFNPKSGLWSNLSWGYEGFGVVLEEIKVGKEMAIYGATKNPHGSLPDHWCNQPNLLILVNH